LANGLVPILCVGESLEVRAAGDEVAHVTAQLTAALADVSIEQAAVIVVAYEPIWAIGTGRVATAEDAQRVCAAIRTRLGELYSAEVACGVRVLYGGSVKAGNAAEILAQPDVDGALVGGASLDGPEFAKICTAAVPGSAS
jgi:triosephosphate isomerase